MVEAEGWAVIQDGKIDVRTISPTRRAAIVNWLVVRGRCWISTSTSDSQIEEYWRENRLDHEVAEVAIRAKVQ